MRRLHHLALAAVLPAAIAADAPRPRGVGPDLAKHYKSPDAFACIFNPSITLDPSRINDDYCDCPDGSDEPGTAACAHLSYHAPSLPEHASISGANTTLAIPGFYCKNKGHQPAYLPLTHVNDGVCDYSVCCDGSDEYAGVGGVKCPDKCKEIGKQWRAQDDIRQKSMTAALKKRVELVTQAGRLRKEVEDKIKDIEAQIEGSQIKVKDLEIQLADAERIARGKIVKSPGKAGKTGVLAGLAKGRIDELRNGLVQVQEQRNQARGRLAEVEQILSTFKEEYNPNFNDEGVKRAVRAWEDYAARDKDAEGAIKDEDLVELLKPDTESGVIDWEEWERPEEDELATLYAFESYLPPTLRTWVDAKLKSLRLFLIENGVIASSADSGSTEDPAVASARTELSGAQNSLSQQERDLTAHRADLDKDYGTDEVFRALQGRCVAKDAGEYTYELCYLDQAKQRSRKGGGDTNMGNFAGFELTHVDEELPVDGKGLGSGPRLAMRHENGQGCWNGPSRSTYVVLACSEEDEIWKIAEEEKCVYRMEVGSPAVCERRTPSAGQGAKDEL